MEALDCRPNALFDEGVQELFDQMVNKLFTEVESSAAAILKTYTGVFNSPPREAGDLNRLLGQSVKTALPGLLDKRLLGSIAHSLTGDLACSARELRQKLNIAGIRPVEHDILYLLLFGFKHGLRDNDIAFVPVNDVSFKFRIDPSFTRVELAEIQLEFINRSAERRYLSTSSTSGSLQRVGAVATKSSSPETIGWFVWVLALPWKEIFRCLRSLVELINEALASGEENRIAEAIDAIEDALEDIDDDIEDVKEEIEDLKEEIREEDDPKDKKELEEDLKDLEEKKEMLEDAGEDLNDARRKLKKALKKG
jgi:tetratricopeptide (TPR) repeat protein